MHRGRIRLAGVRAHAPLAAKIGRSSGRKSGRIPEENPWKYPTLYRLKRGVGQKHRKTIDTDFQGELLPSFNRSERSVGVRRVAALWLLPAQRLAHLGSVARCQT